MTLHLLILDVTAMHGSAVCVAGLDIDTGRTIRLNAPTPDLTTVRKLGIKPGLLIEVDWKPVHPQWHPHTEDGTWDEHSVKIVKSLPFSEVLALVQAHAFNAITEAFGEPWFTSGNGNSAWHPAEGERSLASVVVQSVGCYEDRPKAPRIHLLDAAGKHWHGVPLQDLQAKLHAPDCESCASHYMKNIRGDFAGEGTIVRVGLTRPYKPPDYPEACWLQVTNVLARERTHFA